MKVLCDTINDACSYTSFPDSTMHNLSRLLYSEESLVPVVVREVQGPGGGNWGPRGRGPNRAQGPLSKTKTYCCAAVARIESWPFLNLKC